MSTTGRQLNPNEYQGSATSVDDSRVIVTGENSFFRLSENDDDADTTVVSFRRNHFSPAAV